MKGYCRPSEHFPHVWQARAARSAAALTPDVQFPDVESSGETRGNVLSSVALNGPINWVRHHVVPFFFRMIVSAACAKTSISAVFGSIPPPAPPRRGNSRSGTTLSGSAYIFRGYRSLQLTLRICAIQRVVEAF